MNKQLNALQKELSAVIAFTASEISGLRAELAKISLRIENVKKMERLEKCDDNYLAKSDTFDVKEVFSRYSETKKLEYADIFHLYDTGKECMKNNDGYNDSRHFELVAFNTDTMQKKNCGQHDGITSFSNDLPIRMIRVYADGSFFIKFGRIARIELFQNVNLV